MTIAHEQLGFFSEHLVQSMTRQGISAKALAIELECSYEFVRRMIKTECLPSPLLLKRMCALFRWNRKETRKLILIDKARKKFGRNYWIWLGKNPDHERFYILWHFLSPAEQQYFSEWLRYLVARKQRNQDIQPAGLLTPNQDIWSK
jgi:hypothetical protein